MSFAVSSSLPLEATACSSSNAPPGRMLQLDGIRGAAILSVLAWHWLPYPYLRYCPLGVIAVRVFFVLSGFLITGILLRSRQQIEAAEVEGAAGTAAPQRAWWSPLRQFYIRRTLRIFPLYYLVLAIILIGGVPAAREHCAWFLTYLSNFLGATQTGTGGSTAHFWSLAVEEQFYIVWPWVVLFARRKIIPWTIGAMLLVGPIWRFTTYAWTDGNYAAAATLPIGCLDSLGVGALLAWLADACRARPRLCERVALAMLCAGVPIFALGIYFYCQDNLHIGWVVLTDLGVALIAGWLIWRASRGIKGPLGWCLEFPPLIFLGTVSYCIYVVHPFIHNITPRMFQMIGLGVPRVRWHLSIDFAATMAIATASWFLFEKRLIRLGRTLAPDAKRV
jgi:peptidoglycan/LPS O-acetylase OafA/YrhL